MSNFAQSLATFIINHRKKNHEESSNAPRWFLPTKNAWDPLITITNLTPGFNLSVLSLIIKFLHNNKKIMSILLIHNTLTKLWSNFLINEREKMVSILKLAKTFCAQKSDTNEIKRLTKAGICTIIAQTVLRCTSEYPILLDFWNIQYTLITFIFLRITWSPVYCRWGVSLNLAVQRHTFFSPNIILILKRDIWRNWDEKQYWSVRDIIVD